MTYENKFEFVFASLLNACHLFFPWHSYGKLDTAEVARGIGAILKTSQIQNRPTCFMLPNYYVHDGRSVCQKISKPNCQFLRLNSFVADSCWNMQACWCPFMSISIQSIEASSCHSLSFQSTSLHIIAHHLYITHHGTLLIAALVCVINSQAWRMHTKHPDVNLANDPRRTYRRWDKSVGAAFCSVCDKAVTSARFTTISRPWAEKDLWHRLLAPNTSLQFDVSIFYQLQFQVTSPVLLQQSTLMCYLWLYTRDQCKTIKSPKPFKTYQSDISFYSFKIHDYYVGCRTDFHFLNDWGQTFPEAQALAPTQSTKKCVEFAMTIIRYWCW